LSENNGFGDITAINAFQRMVDPGVAVREGDVTLLQSAIPRLRALGLTVGNLVEGDKLTFQAREQLKQLAKKLANTRITSSQQAISDLREIAKDAGINPDRVIRELKVEISESENLANSAKQKFMQMKEMPEGEEKEQLKKELKVLVEQLRATQKK
jgi:molecular chaperone DnaK (HSP70)